MWRKKENILEFDSMNWILFYNSNLKEKPQIDIFISHVTS